MGPLLLVFLRFSISQILSAVARFKIGEKIVKAVRDITHIDGDKGKSKKALGFRDSRLTVEVKITAKEKGEKLIITFPK